MDGKLSQEILFALGKLSKLQTLELINFDGEPEMDQALMVLSNLRRLLIIPKFTNKVSALMHNLRPYPV